MILLGEVIFQYLEKMLIMNDDDDYLLVHHKIHQDRLLQQHLHLIHHLCKRIYLFILIFYYSNYLTHIDENA